MKSLSIIFAALTAAVSFGFAQSPVPDFAAGVSYPTAGNSSMATVADFNGDGLPDIITVEAITQSLSLLRGKPNGKFQPLVSIPLGFTVSSTVAGDFNGDHKTDLAFTTATGVAVLLNNGAGTFAPPAFYSAGIVPNYIAAADLDHDGRLDLAVAGANGFAVLPGLPGGAFGAPQVLPQIAPSFYLILADFNKDGNIDLLGDGGAQGQFYAGLGNGSFALPVATLAIPYGTTAGDFNGDGILDLSNTVTQQQQHGSVQALAIATGTGSGQFLVGFELVLTGASIGQPVAGDFNGDGKLDVAVLRRTPGDLVVYPGDGAGTLQATPLFQTTVPAGGVLMARDTDANGSKDLLLLNVANVTLWRNTHGNPPLLASIAANTPWIVGGNTSQATVTLGGPAPAAGAVVQISSSNPSLALPLSGPTVTIPAGTSSGTFTLSTNAAAASTAVRLSATWRSITQSIKIHVVPPYALSSLGINPASQFGIFTTQGTVTLSGPADGNAVVSFSSANPLLASVPATVTVAPGATSAIVTIALQPVAVDTPVSIRASFDGVTKSALVTVLKPLDSLQITRAQYTARQAELRVEATSTNSSAALTAWNADTGSLIGNMTNSGGGKFTGTFTVPTAVLNVTLKSSQGGIVTGSVTQK